MPRRISLASALCAALTAAASLAACPADAPAPASRALRDGERLVVDVQLPEGAGAGLRAAADDLTAALLARAGATSPGAARLHVRVVLSPADAELGPESYRIEDTRDGLVVRAAAETGAMYGLYHVAAELGALWIHPEEPLIVAADPAATLPAGHTGAVEAPRFALRGFHEHTQHPTPMSDALLRPDVPGFRALVSRQIRWLARNRQNTLTFHLLNTVDLDAWTPWMRDIADEARAHGVTLGAVVGFVDQQQNAFRLVKPGATDPSTGAPLAPEAQIRAGLDRLVAAGLGVIGLQIGTSEFTKPDEASILAWLDLAVAHLRAEHPAVAPFAWIHITCDLERDAGGYYYHLPLEADPGLGALVHTTMFYTLTDPAPVYGCDDFGHQLEFMAAADGARRQVFFPESAWWLGFDNNVPLLLPITGLSRERDLFGPVADHAVDGHLTFTTGREWTYWQYDHYLTRATWDGVTRWDGYLSSLAPVYGADADASLRALRALTELEVQAFYETDPLLFFYLAGELPQDELGAQAGILARRPKLAFKEVAAYDDEAYAAWEATDLARLRDLRDDLNGVAAALPAPGTATTRGYRELYAAATLLARRAAHAVTLYEGVGRVRAGDRAGAEAHLAAARAVSAEARALVAAAEADYRDPLALLVGPKPESLTAYPFGYLHETSTAFFWTRRDDQLAALIARTFDGVAEAWSATPPPTPVFALPPAGLSVVDPESPVLGALIGGFVPQLLFGVAAFDPASGALSLALAQDQDQSGLPDPDTELTLAATLGPGSRFAGSASVYAVAVHDATGERKGDLVIAPFALELTVSVDAAAVSGLGPGEISGTLGSAEVSALVRSVAGIEEEALAELMKDIWGIPAASPLPERLPLRLRLSFDAAPR